MVRKQVVDRYYKVFTYQPVDRVTDMEFGFWPQTLRRWLREGMPITMTPAETNRMFGGKPSEFFGFDRWGWGAGPNMQMMPEFAEEVLERKAGSVIKRDAEGIVAEVFEADSDDSSIPHYIEFPVKGPADWARLRERYRLDDPARKTGEDVFAGLRQARDNGTCIGLNVMGFYGRIRYWMGTENLSYALYDYPEMIHEMVELWSELAVQQVRAWPADIVVDSVNWWEDMAGRNGPLVSPQVFRDFFQPGYRKVMAEAHRRGCAFGTVDSDGNPHDLVPHWLEEGVTVMHPLEVAAGVDPFAWRKEFGRELRLRGGIDKRALAKGRAAIDAELERIKPLLDQGGYVPHVDHAVPPDVSYADYCYYREKKLKLIGKTQ
jgi:hypothetical protein